MEPEGAASFAALLRRYRVAAGLSQQALAERSGLSVRAISDLERGARRSPYRETVRLLANALSLDAMDRAMLDRAVERARGRRIDERSVFNPSGQSLPAAVTPLIGRDQVIAELRMWLIRGDARLLTLTGPPGIGKTRLALALAAEMTSDWPDGIFFVGLTPIVEPRLVATSILQALGFTDIGGRPPAEQLRHVLREKKALLVLDNFEQVVDAAPLVGELLATCAVLTALVTSRIALHLRGEHEFPVPPLELPDSTVATDHPLAIQTLAGSPAVALFLERARAVNPDFVMTPDNVTSVVEVCRRLDGLPLAIELAAARCKVLTPHAMLDRIEHRLDLLTGGARDAPERQRTLRAAIAWSHDLLSAEERILFRRLGVFVGGCTLASVESVCDDGEFDLDVLNGISGLVDQSLVLQSEGADAELRFFMLETLREYALEQLETTGERQRMQERHAADVLALAIEAESYLVSGDRGPWLRRLSEEQDNIRAALSWALGQDDPELGLRLVGVLWLWFMRRLLIEGRQWSEELLAHPGAGKRTAGKAGALFAAGHFAWLQGDVRAMRIRMQEAVAIWQELGDAAGLGRALPFLGLAIDDDHATARRFAEDGVVYCRGINDRWGLALALTNLGRIEATWGDDASARPALEEAAALFHSLADEWLVALAMTSLGAIVYRAGNYAEARAAFAEALPCFRAVEDRRNTTQALTNLGYVALAHGEVGEARAIFAESLAFGREHGDRFNSPACLRGFAAAEASIGNLASAVRLYAAADEMSVATGATRWPAERLGGPVSVNEICVRLGEEACEAAWSAGQALPPEDTLAELLARRDEFQSQ